MAAVELGRLSDLPMSCLCQWLSSVYPKLQHDDVTLPPLDTTPALITSTCFTSHLLSLSLSHSLNSLFPTNYLPTSNQMFCAALAKIFPFTKPPLLLTFSTTSRQDANTSQLLEFLLYVLPTSSPCTACFQACSCAIG